MGDLVAVVPGRRRRRAVRAARGDPRRPGLGLRGPVRRRRPRPQAAVAGPGQRPRARRGRRPRGSARRRRRPAPRSDAHPFPYLLLLDADDRPIGWVDRATLPGAARSRRPGRRDVAAPRPPDDAQGRALDAARRRRPGGRRGRPPGRVPGRRHRRADRRLHARARPARPRERVPEADASAGPRDDGRRVIDWAWVADHLDELVARTLQHLGFACSRLAIGFAISFALCCGRSAGGASTRPITAFAGILYTIPSLALFASLVPITGLSLLTAIIPLVLYTILIFVRNIVAGSTRSRRDITEAADGDGLHPRASGCGRVELPLALPLIVAGLRSRASRPSGSSRSRARSATASAASGSSSSRATCGASRPRSCSARSRRCSSPSPWTSRSSASRAGSRRGRAPAPTTRCRRSTPSPRTPRRGGRLMDILGEIFAWLTDPAHWTGPSGIPVRLAEHLAISLAALADRAPRSPSRSACSSATPGAATDRDQPREPRPRDPVARADRHRRPDHGAHRPAVRVQGPPDAAGDDRPGDPADPRQHLHGHPEVDRDLTEAARGDGPDRPPGPARRRAAAGGRR